MSLGLSTAASGKLSQPNAPAFGKKLLQRLVGGRSNDYGVILNNREKPVNLAAADEFSNTIILELPDIHGQEAAHEKALRAIIGFFTGHGFNIDRVVPKGLQTGYGRTHVRAKVFGQRLTVPQDDRFEYYKRH